MSSPEALQEIVDADAATRAKDRKIPRKKALAARILITIAALAIWFWTQSLLGARNRRRAAAADCSVECLSAWRATRGKRVADCKFGAD